MCNFIFCFFFFQAEDGIRYRNVTGVQTCALPISFRTPSAVSLSDFFMRPSVEPARGGRRPRANPGGRPTMGPTRAWPHGNRQGDQLSVSREVRVRDRKSTRLNSSHVSISYAVFCLKK